MKFHGIQMKLRILLENLKKNKYFLTWGFFGRDKYSNFCDQINANSNWPYW